MPNQDNEIFNEWASGVSLATGNDSNEFFQEIPTELAKPADFQVPVPDPTPDPVPVPTPVVAVEEDKGPETRPVKNGGTMTLEKTSRGWRLTLSTGDPKIAPENFYGPNKDELIYAVADAKVESNRTIHRLKKEKFLGGGEEATITPSPSRNIAKVAALSADDVYEIKNQLAENPADAIDTWVKKRFGLDPDEFAEALKSAPEAKKILDAQTVKGNIDEVNNDFCSTNPDYLEYVTTSDSEVNQINMRLLVGRMAKSYLNKKITKSTAQPIVDDAIYEIYKRGKWTVENLETAKEELIENELFERSESRRTVPEPQPEPVAVKGPSVPATQPIVATPGQPVGLIGLSAKGGSPVAAPEEKPLTDVDLQSIPLSDLKAIAMAQLRAQQQGRQ